MLDKNTQEIVIEDDNLFADVSSLLEGSSVNLRHYSDPTLPLDKLYSVETNIEALLKEKVWLKSGGNIIIQHTEALTVVDVNTSKAIKIKGESEKTFLKVNLEAAKEIAKQISLRNIGGIIIVDFINMKERKNIQTLVEAFRKELGKDYVKADVVDVTKLNLVEVTRQKIKVPLRRQLRDI
jgi:ribonuclease G